MVGVEELTEKRLKGLEIFVVLAQFATIQFGLASYSLTVSSAAVCLHINTTHRDFYPTLQCVCVFIYLLFGIKPSADNQPMYVQLNLGCTQKPGPALSNSAPPAINYDSINHHFNWHSACSSQTSLMKYKTKENFNIMPLKSSPGKVSH